MNQKKKEKQFFIRDLHSVYIYTVATKLYCGIFALYLVLHTETLCAPNGTSDIESAQLN